jgi:hypothetical protein
MLEVDFLTTEGNFDLAVRQIDDIISLSDGDDAIPYVFKANTLAQKVCSSLSLSMWLHNLSRSLALSQAMHHFAMCQQLGSQADLMIAQSLFSVASHTAPHMSCVTWMSYLYSRKLMSCTRKPSRWIPMVSYCTVYPYSYVRYIRLYVLTIWSRNRGTCAECAIEDYAWRHGGFT